MKLIDKDALVAEIERMIKHYNVSAKEFGDEGYNDNVLMEQCKASACEHILSFIDSLEVKEVDLDTEIAKWEESFKHYPASMGYKETAKHFFELGMRFSAIGSDYIEGVRGYYETTTK